VPHSANVVAEFVDDGVSATLNRPEDRVVRIER